MIKEFIPYEQALALKELGFDEPCFGYYIIDDQELVNDKWMQHPNESTWTINAPTFSQTFMIFREKCGLHSYIEPVLVEKANSPIKYDYVILEVFHQDDLEYNNLPYHTFEDAELACLEKLIQIVKDGK